MIIHRNSYALTQSATDLNEIINDSIDFIFYGILHMLIKSNMENLISSGKLVRICIPIGMMKNNY